ncbi:MAG: phosphate signaling complex protein PhoU [Lachnoclostridium sp.]|jgi:phosphate transport system protein|nr:phosphate signaling complex protein PhoU [Lachnoclostridium sp.]
MREHFIKQLEELNKSLHQMGIMIQEAIHSAVEALKTLDKDKAREIIDADYRIDHKEKEIESASLHLLLQQTPVAGDLRQVSAALKMVTDMERIGDHAADISEIVLFLDRIEYKVILDLLLKMADTTSKMLANSINAYLSEDLQLAKEVAGMDDIVDLLFLEVKQAIANEVVSNKEKGEQVLDLLMIAKYFERIGDHAENISEWVVFSITGLHKNERVI